MLDAVLVSLADHGLTPTVLAARLTYTGAPESMQGAVAAGLLGRRQRVPRAWPRTPPSSSTRSLTEARRRTTARCGRAAIASAAAGRRVPGLGHPVHKIEDPRTPRDLRASPRKPACSARTCALLRLVAEAHAAADRPGAADQRRRRGRRALADLGFPPAIVRGFALIARTAGLVAHLAEEMDHPIGMGLFLDADRRADYTGG